LKKALVKFFELFLGYLVRRRLKSANVSISAGFRCRSINVIRLSGNPIIHIASNVRILSPINIKGPAQLEIGKNALLARCNLSISGPSIVTLADNVILGNTEIVNNISVQTGTLVIGAHSYVQSCIYIRFHGRLEIGSYTGCGSETEFSVDNSIRVGNYCLLSYNIKIYDTNSHSTNYVLRRQAIERYGLEFERPDTSPIWIGDDVWIGRDSFIAKGVSIGSRSIIGMGTVVSPGAYPEDARIVMDKPRVIVNKQLPECGFPAENTTPSLIK